jgi:hypothetical protein
VAGRRMVDTTVGGRGSVDGRGPSAPDVSLGMLSFLCSDVKCYLGNVPELEQSVCCFRWESHHAADVVVESYVQQY